MSLPAYLDRNELTEPPISYKWTRPISNSFVANPGDSHPKLADALELISIRATFALSVACTQWVVARFQKQIDPTDASLRIQAANAAMIDWRYANLPRPDYPNPENLDPITEPPVLALRLLTYALDYYRKAYSGGNSNKVRAIAVGSILLAQHVAPKASRFKEWLADSLSRARDRYPAQEVPLPNENPIPPDFFDPAFAWSPEAVTASHAQLLQTLNPTTNPYLRSADDMRADGFEGDPYRQSR